jgi:DNA-binding transcriptional LysR family regulator
MWYNSNAYLLYLLCVYNMIDYDTLKALRLLLEHRHISRAAQQAGITQPAMSRTLMRLQKVFADPLLVRTPQGFELTPRAISLLPQLLETMTKIESLVRPEKFDPKTAQRQFTIAALDYEMIVALIPCMNKLLHIAPGIHLNIQQQWGKNFSHLAKGAIDFLISAEEDASSGFYRQVLYQDEFVCTMSIKNPMAKKEKLTLKDYLSLKHCVVSITGVGKTQVDADLAAQGKRREVVMHVPSFTVALDVCQQTSLACILPRRLLEERGAHLLKLYKLPFTMPTLTVYLYWHERLHKDQESIWLRHLLGSIDTLTKPGG